MKIVFQFFLILFMSNFVYCADTGSPRSGVLKSNLPIINQVRNSEIHKSHQSIDTPVGQHFTRNSSTTPHNVQSKKNLAQAATRTEPKPTKVKILKQ